MEEYIEQPYIVYVKTDDANRITAVNSSEFLRNRDGWTEIDSGYGDKYHHAQGNYFNKPLFDDRGLFRYKLEGVNVIERTEEEMSADYVPPVQQPSEEERITALEAQLAAYEAAYTQGVNEA